MAKIIVVSDIHHSASAASDVYDAEHVSHELIDSVKDNTYDLLLRALENEKEPADLLVFCGDYVVGREDNIDKHKAIDAFAEFLSKVECSNSVLSGDDKANRIIIAPGNHDVTRNTGDTSESYELFRDKTSRYLTPFTKDPHHPYAPTFVFDSLKLIVSCETTNDNSSTTNEKVARWIEMIEKSKATNEQKEGLLSEMRAEMTKDIPSISASTKTRFIETAHQLSGDEHEDYLRVMVTHHPLLSGAETKKVIKSFGVTVGGFDFMKSAMEFGYELFIHGHTHEQSCIELIDFGSERPLASYHLGVPQLVLDSQSEGLIEINTNNQRGRWPFEVRHKMLSSYTHDLRQTAFVDGNTAKSESAYESRAISGNAFFGANASLLVDADIKKLIDEGVIIKNGDYDRIEAASYDCAMGYEYKRSKSRQCDWSKEKLTTLEKTDGASSITIEAHEAVLLYTFEEFEIPKDMVMHASPISTWLRQGLHVEISHFVDPGFSGRFCFPVVNEGNEPITISSREPIMSIELIALTKACEKGWAERHPEKAERRKERRD